MAAEYGWTSRHVWRELTDEKLVMYLDAAADRQAARFESDVEAFRAGAIFAQDDKQHRRWQRSRQGDKPSRGLVGDALEAALLGLRAMHPDIVTVRTA